MTIIDPRLESLKKWTRAMRSYVLTLFEIVLETRPEFVLEIGTQLGQSTKSMLLAMGKNRFGKLISVDQKRRSDILDVEYPDLKEYCQFIKGSSHDPVTLQVVRNSLPEGKLFDIALIDGDHTYEGVKADYEDYYPLVKDGGLLILHDICNINCGVPQFWKEIKDEKFAFNWGKAQNSIVPGLGFCRKEKKNLN